MSERIACTDLDPVVPTGTAFCGDASAPGGRWPLLRYCDARFSVSETRSAMGEDGSLRSSSEDSGWSVGVRVIAGQSEAAPGFAARVLGPADRRRVPDLLAELTAAAYERACHNAARRAAARRDLGAVADALRELPLASVAVHQARVEPDCRVDPRTVPLEAVAGLVREVASAIAAVPRIGYSMVATGTWMERECFCSSEGAALDQWFAFTESFVYVVGVGDAAVELYDTHGHQRGWEVAVAGVDEPLMRQPPLRTFAEALARDAAELCVAPPAPTTDRPVTVVTDPHFNALVAHEVVGHPTELDRALKMETAYAGRSWLLRSANDTMLGREVASPFVTAYADPRAPGYGHYVYDHEGTPATRVTLIDRGVLRGFMNSRQTAALLGAEPNGSARANDAAMVPLIRMSNVFFSAGDRDPAEILKEVSHGYYVVGHRIPSIAESRENFRITAMKVYEVRNGEVGQLYRDGGIASSTHDFFRSIDAVGSDLRLLPIPNCGKGQPMQTKRLGNGGPTMRGQAFLTGP